MLHNIMKKIPLYVGTMLQGHVCFKKSFSYYKDNCIKKD